jgi:hypothetical protein
MPKRSLYLSCVLLSPLLTSGATVQVPATASDTVSVTGCVTASADGKSYVLTADPNPLASTTARSAGTNLETFTYALVGGQNLKPEIGRKVTVTGRLEKAKDRVDADTKDVSEQPRTDKPGGSAQVESKQDIDINIRQQRVETVKPTGQPCDTQPQK